MFTLRRCIGDRGASAVEYGLIVFAIAATIAIAVFAFGPVVVGLFSGACQDMVASTNSTRTCS